MTAFLRMVSLVPSFTELLVKWGLGDRLVGRTSFCTEPAWIQEKVLALGGPKNPDIPGILALHPDLILMEKSENCRATYEALTDAGSRIEVLDLRNLEDVLKAFMELGQLLECRAQGEAEAQALLRLLQQDPLPPIPTLVLVWKNPWISAGPGTYLADLCQHAGFICLGPKGYPRLTELVRCDEEDRIPDSEFGIHILNYEFLTQNPECILLPTDPYPFGDLEVRDLQAFFPEARIHVLEGKSLTWSLSRTAEGLRILRDLRAAEGNN